MVFPARAGMFRTQSRQEPRTPGFPRASGDVPLSSGNDAPGMAFSPRERGCSRQQHVRVDGFNVFPARAGMFPALIDTDPVQESFPRASGDVPEIRGTISDSDLFSPRERGCSRANKRLNNRGTVFPARAGMFPHRTESPCGWSSFPRASGDVPHQLRHVRPERLFSPRERGCSPLPG